MKLLTKNFAAGVLSLRQALGETQEGMARRLGMSLRGYVSWERGERQPRGAALRAILDLCPDEATRARLLDPWFSSLVPERGGAPAVVSGPSAGGGSAKGKMGEIPHWVRRLDPELRLEITKALEIIDRLEARKQGGNAIAAEGLRRLAEKIVRAAGLLRAAEATKGRGVKPRRAPQSVSSKARD